MRRRPSRCWARRCASSCRRVLWTSPAENSTSFGFKIIRRSRQLARPAVVRSPGFQQTETFSPRQPAAERSWLAKSSSRGSCRSRDRFWGFFMSSGEARTRRITALPKFKSSCWYFIRMGAVEVPAPAASPGGSVVCHPASFCSLGKTARLPEQWMRGSPWR